MSNLHIPKTIEELKKLHKPVHHINVEVKSKLSHLDRLAFLITAKVGSIGFFIIIFCWTFFWLGWNLLAPVNLRFDPFPAFALWLFISNMIQIFLMPLIMIGQNLQSKQSDIRADADFEVNKKAEMEIETILMHLENQNNLMLQILKTIEKSEKID